jgi:hypothetical protein
MAAAGLFGSALTAADAETPADYAQTIAPFLETHCTSCHSGSEPEAKLALDGYQTSSKIQTDFATWEKVLRMLESRQMPPSDQPQPTEEEFQRIVKAIDAELETYDCSSERHPGRVTLRRLNRVEYNTTIRDLVGVTFHPADEFPADDVGEGFDNIGDVLTLPPILMEKYLAAAEKIVNESFANEELRKKLVPHGFDGDREDRRRDIADFASRAFRRPVTDDEVNRLMSLRRTARDARLSHEDSTKIVFEAILSSPYFLFRVEKDPAPDDPDGIRELDDYELATRLSYFLWSSMPDQELFDLAARGELHDPGMLDAQARRMLHDPKAQALVDNFAGQWLQLRDVARVAPDPEKFPSFDDNLRKAALRETQLFFSSIVQEDRSILEFLTADFSYVNERLAKHYGISGVTGDEFVKVSLPANRRGILTQASILTLTSNPTRTSPVKRGKWILDNLLGEPPPPPPPGIEPLSEEGELLGTFRERLEQHRADPNCAVCHRQMDQLGFSLEKFDAIGAFREKDGRFDIDASGVLPGGGKFDTPAEMVSVLSEHKREAFCRCLTEKMLTYSLGRGLVPYDRCAVKAIMKQLSENDYRMSALVSGIVTSDPFRFREAKGEP